MSLMSPRDPRAVLGRAVVRLQARVTTLAERLEAGDEGAWAPYCVAIEALAVVAPAPRVLPRVRVPLPNGGELRRLLFDRADLDRLIDVWKDQRPMLSGGA